MTILRSPLLWFALYLAVLLTITVAMLQARQRARQVYAGEAAHADWDAWRAEAAKQAEGEGPVRRRKPKSAEPPALVLMRDHFAACLVGSLLLGSALFVSFMVFIRGVLGSRPTIDFADSSTTADANRKR